MTDTGTWVNVAGSWGYGVDALAGGGGLGAGLAEIQHDIGPRDHATFEATFESTRPPTSLTGVRIGFESGKVFSCLVYVDGGGAQMVNLYEDTTLKQMAAFAGTSAMHLSLMHLAADNSIRCRARIDGRPATVVNYPASISARGDKISIVAKDSDIEVWSAVVFATQ